MIRAAPGHVLVGADFSAIESRVLAWLAGEIRKLNTYRRYDATGDPTIEPYCVTASDIQRRPVTPDGEADRQIGKVCDLAFGYGGALGAWRKFDDSDNHSDAQVENFKSQWRSAHPATVRLWRGLESAAHRAIRTGLSIGVGHLSFVMEDGTLFMRLPSGRRLAYPEARLAPGKYGDEVEFKDNAQGKWVDRRAWYGTLVENAVQAVSRDLLAAAMQRLEAAGYPVVLHVHDEVVCEVPKWQTGSAEEFLRLMTELPDWAAGLPIAAKVWTGQRYAKSPRPAERPTAQPGDTIPPLKVVASPSIAIGLGEVTGEAEFQTMTSNNEDTERVNGSGGNGRVWNDYASEWQRDGARPSHNSDGNVHGDSGAKHGRRTAQWFYPYLDRSNYLRVDRHDGSERKFYQYHWNGARWISGVKGTYAERKIPYRLPELKEALQTNPGIEVQICEGESDADALARLGFVVTTNPGGALSWTPELTA
jgi:hypothetical protein